MCVCVACSADKFSCRGRPCLDMRQRCNGVMDCPDLSDERHCACNTTSRLALCNSSGLCVRRCDDLSDEQHCGLYVTWLQSSFLPTVCLHIHCSSSSIAGVHERVAS